VAYLALINERLLLRGDVGGWRASSRRTANSSTAHYYHPATLASPAARRVFILGEFRDPPYGAQVHTTGRKQRNRQTPACVSLG
jgi:hypothetical protein